MSIPENLPPLLTVEEMGKILRCGRVKAYQLANKKDFPTVKVGRNLRVPTEALFKWIEAQKG